MQQAQDFREGGVKPTYEELEAGIAFLKVEIAELKQALTGALCPATFATTQLKNLTRHGKTSKVLNTILRWLARSATLQGSRGGMRVR